MSEILKERAIQAQREIANLLGVNPDGPWKRDVEDLLYGVFMQAMGKGIQDRVMARVKAKRESALPAKM